MLKSWAARTKWMNYLDHNWDVIVKKAFSGFIKLQEYIYNSSPFSSVANQKPRSPLHIFYKLQESIKILSLFFCPQYGLSNLPFHGQLVAASGDGHIQRPDPVAEVDIGKKWIVFQRTCCCCSSKTQTWQKHSSIFSLWQVADRREEHLGGGPGHRGEKLIQGFRKWKFQENRKSGGENPCLCWQLASGERRGESKCQRGKWEGHWVDVRKVEELSETERRGEYEQQWRSYGSLLPGFEIIRTIQLMKGMWSQYILCHVSLQFTAIFIQG